MKISAPVIETVPVEKLKPWNRNPRKNHAVDEISKSMQAFGYMAPIICQKGTYRILAGHGRLMALKKLGVTEVPVIVADMDDDKASLYAVADNKLTEKAEWDFGTLADMLLEWEHKNFDTTLTGFDDKELEQIMNWVPGNDGEETKPIPEPPAEAVSKTGDLWELGVHRLLCGDSTKSEDVARVMDGKKAGLMVTSPPYNQQIDQFKPSGMHRKGGWVQKVSSLAYADSLPEDEYQRLQSNGLLLWYEALDDHASAFYNHKNRYRGKRMISPMLWLPGPFNLRQEIVWSRPGSVTQNARMFLPSDERIYWMYKGDDFLFHDTTEIKSWSTVWDINLETNKDHAVGFPLALPSRCISACSEVGWIVLEPYCGSGTTLIAAEKLGRRCYAIEIEPRYVDVCVKRWQNFTGKRAKNLTRPDVVL